MSTTAPPEPPKRRGLPRAFVAFCIAIGALIGAYAVVTLLSLTTASTEHRSRTFAAVGELRIDSGSGDVTIAGQRRSDIRVDMAIQRGMWRGAWQPSVETRRGGSSLRLGSRCSFWAHVGVGECGASFVISVPIGTRVVVNASSGNVRIAGMADAVSVDASSGDVEADASSGPLRLAADSGDVTVQGYRGTEISARTGSGDVDLNALSAPRSVRAEAGSGNVTIAVPDVRYRVSLQTGSGSQHVQVRRDPNAARGIEAKAGSGDVTIQRLSDTR
jgi:hypothetical protein